MKAEAAQDPDSSNPLHQPLIPKGLGFRVSG